ncbi:MAG TPA: MlaD family protein [Pseudonocardia sp.]|jgi:phospholipid/cholesterol/gamma-HCH transport system substrate-binding protein|uniref:MlaD family protein n=1 Tax=Pseudonocardia sp. TaxID=60912 RepID=UPI002ED9A674
MRRVLERVRTEPGLARNTVVVVALVAIAGVVGGIILGNQRLVAPWSDRLVVTADFPATPGISPGNGQEVRIAGVNVGDIAGADVAPDGHARLTLSLEPGHRLYQNATLVLRPKSPLNEMYVTIAPGAPPAPVVSSGYQFPITSSERPVQVDEVLNHLDDNGQRMLTSLLAESDVALTSARADLPAGLDATTAVANHMRPVAEQLAQRKELIRRLITALGQIAQAVGGDDQRVRTLAAGLQTTLHSFGTHQPQVDQTLAELPGLLAELKRSTDAVHGLSDQLDPTLHNLADASDRFPEALHDLRGTADKLDAVVGAADPFLDAARPVVADLRPFVGELSTTLPELHAVTQRLDPMTNALLPYLPDLAAFTVQTRSIVSLEDSNNGVLRATAPYSFQTPPPVLGTNNGVKPLPAGVLGGN